MTSSISPQVSLPSVADVSDYTVSIESSLRNFLRIAEEYLISKDLACAQKHTLGESCSGTVTPPTRVLQAIEVIGSDTSYKRCSVSSLGLFALIGRL